MRCFSKGLEQGAKRSRDRPPARLRNAALRPNDRVRTGIFSVTGPKKQALKA